MERSGSSAEFDVGPLIRGPGDPDPNINIPFSDFNDNNNNNLNKKPIISNNIPSHIGSKSTPSKLKSVSIENTSSSEDIEKKNNVALAAAMAASVPIVIDLFQKEFNWFSKEWDRMTMTCKTNFTTKLRNELVNINKFENIGTLQSPQSSKSIDPMKQVKLLRQASFNPLNSLKSQINEKKEQDDLEGMMVPLSSKVRWFHRSTSLSVVLTKKDVKALQESEENIKTAIQEVNDIIVPFIDKQTPSKLPPILSSKIIDLYKILTCIVQSSTNSADNKIVRQMAFPTSELISSSITQGNFDDTLVTRLKEICNYAQVQVTLTNLRQNIYDSLQKLYALTNQICFTLKCVDLTVQKISHSDTLQLLACIRT